MWNTPQLKGLHCGTLRFADDTLQALPQCEVQETLLAKLCCFSRSVRVCRDTGESPQLADCLQVRLSPTGPDWPSHVWQLWPCHQAHSFWSPPCLWLPLAHCYPEQRSTGTEDTAPPPRVKLRTITWGYVAVNNGKTLTDFWELKQSCFWFRPHTWKQIFFIHRPQSDGLGKLPK